MKKLLIPALLVGFISGCYTQLLTDQPSLSPPPVEKISYIVDTVTKDTIKVIHRVDTLAAQGNRNCYWVRNEWGQSELRCDDSYYSNYSTSWNMYNNYPWWYEQDIYGNYYGGGYYHQGRNYNPFYSGYYDPYSGYTIGHGSSSNKNTGNRSLRRTSSSAVPMDNPSSPEQKNMRADAPPPPSQPVQNTAPPSPPAGSSNSGNDNNHRRTPPRDW